MSLYGADSHNNGRQGQLGLRSVVGGGLHGAGIALFLACVPESGTHRLVLRLNVITVTTSIVLLKVKVM